MLLRVHLLSVLSIKASVKKCNPLFFLKFSLLRNFSNSVFEWSVKALKNSLQARIIAFYSIISVEIGSIVVIFSSFSQSIVIYKFFSLYGQLSNDKFFFNPLIAEIVKKFKNLGIGL